MISAVHRSERGFAAVEVALRRIRVACGLLLALGAVVQYRRAAPAPTWAGAAALAVLLLAVAVVCRRTERSDTGHEQLLVTLELVVDLVAASAVVLWAGGIGSPAGALLALPVLHAACRWQTTGALGMWAGIAFVLLCRAIWRWDPGTGLGQLTEPAVPLAVLLALGMIAGHLTDQLAVELDRQERLADRAERQAELLGAVTTAAAELHAAPAGSLATVTVEAAARLGFAYAALVDRSRPTAPLAATGPFADPTPAVALVVPVPGTTLELYASGDADEPERAEALDLVVGLLAAATRRAYERADLVRTAAEAPAPPATGPLPARRRWFDPIAAAPTLQPPVAERALADSTEDESESATTAVLPSMVQPHVAAGRPPAGPPQQVRRASAADQLPGEPGEVAAGPDEAGATGTAPTGSSDTAA